MFYTCPLSVKGGYNLVLSLVLCGGSPKTGLGIPPDRIRGYYPEQIGGTTLVRKCRTALYSTGSTTASTLLAPSLQFQGIVTTPRAVRLLQSCKRTVLFILILVTDLDCQLDNGCAHYLACSHFFNIVRDYWLWLQQNPLILLILLWEPRGSSLLLCLDFQFISKIK